MPIGKAAAAAIKKATISLVKELISLAITEGFKQEAMAISQTSVRGEIDRDARHKMLTKKGKQLEQKVDNAADTPITGLSFAMAVQQVFVEARAYTTIDTAKLLDILIGMIDPIENAVDWKYQGYRKNVAKELGKAGTFIDDVSTALGVSENWHQSVNWTGTYTRLRVKLRKQLQAAEDARNKAIAATKGYRSLKAQVGIKLQQSLAELRRMIVKFVNMNRKLKSSSQSIGRSKDELQGLRHRFYLAGKQDKLLMRSGAASWKGEIYRMKDRKRLQEVITGYENKIKSGVKSRKSAMTSRKIQRTSNIKFEVGLYRKLRRIRDLHWQMWQVDAKLKIAEDSEPRRDLGGIPPMTVPWRSGENVMLRNDTYPFNVDRLPASRH